jgi:hypothetical protein
MERREQVSRIGKTVNERRDEKGEEGRMESREVV